MRICAQLVAVTAVLVLLSAGCQPGDRTLRNSNVVTESHSNGRPRSWLLTGPGDPGYRDSCKVYEFNGERWRRPESVPSVDPRLVPSQRALFYLQRSDVFKKELGEGHAIEQKLVLPIGINVKDLRLEKWDIDREHGVVFAGLYENIDRMVLVVCDLRENSSKSLDLLIEFSKVLKPPLIDRYAGYSHICVSAKGEVFFSLPTGRLISEKLDEYEPECYKWDSRTGKVTKIGRGTPYSLQDDGQLETYVEDPGDEPRTILVQRYVPGAKTRSTTVPGFLVLRTPMGIVVGDFLRDASGRPEPMTLMSPFGDIPDLPGLPAGYDALRHEELFPVVAN